MWPGCFGLKFESALNFPGSNQLFGQGNCIGNGSTRSAIGASARASPDRDAQTAILSWSQQSRVSSRGGTIPSIRLSALVGVKPGIPDAEAGIQSHGHFKLFAE